MSGGVVVAVCAVVGAAGGALLMRPAYRLSVPFDTPVRASCADCDAAIGWFGIARCVGCGRRLGPPVWLLALVGSVTCAGIGWRFGLTGELAPFLALTLLGVLLSAIDLACLRLPDVLVKPGFVVGLGWLAGLAVVAGEWGSFVRAGIAAAVLASGYLVLAILPGANLGYGDVKLAGLLGLFLGWLGWGEVLIGAVLPILLNGVVAVVLLVLRLVNRRTLVPFGPAMLAGAWLAIVALPLLR